MSSRSAVALLGCALITLSLACEYEGGGVLGDQEFIDLTSPEGGEVFRPGENIRVYWVSVGLADGHARVLFSSSDEAGGEVLGTDDTGLGYFDFVAPDIDSAECRIRVECGGSFDRSGPFTISRNGGIWHVDGDVAASGDGTAWGTALETVQEAMAASSAGDEIWVAEGTYTNNGGGTATVLAMKNGVRIYGGFAGDETSLDERAWAMHRTTLDGEDTAYHVVEGASVALLDGFTIERGNAAGSSGSAACGGGMYVEGGTSLAVVNCTFAENSADSDGGGVCVSAGSLVSLDNCILSGNTSVRGGGVSAGDSTVELPRCRFLANSATGDGGGVHADSSTIEMTNCVLAANGAGGTGGGLHCSEVVAELTNCSFGGNSATGGGGLSVASNTTLAATNCVLWGDSAPEVQTDGSSSATVRYSCVQNGGTADGNINTDPLFAGAASGNLRLRDGSPCIDAADGSAAPRTDILGEDRCDDAATANTGVGVPPYVDMGACEYRGGTTLIWYVKKGGTGNGSSWESPFGNPQEALAVAQAGDEIWVAEGTHTPTGTTDRTVSFALVAGVAMYGGFAGNETARDQRDSQAHETILSGDIGTQGVTGDNSYHIVIGASDATLDGFTITAGNANGPHADWYDSGAGVKARSVSNMTLTDCRIESNNGDYYAAGLYNENSTLTVTGCAFDDNHGVHGGAVHINNGSIQFSNCVFTNNTADHGGVVLNQPSSSTFVSCVFQGNSSQTGGVLRNSGGNPSFTNCTFVGNTVSSTGSAIHSIAGTTSLTNCILWGNGGSLIFLEFSGACSVNYSDIEGGYGGTANIDSDPLFVGADLGRLDLRAGSLCIDAAEGDVAPGSDIEGKGRYDDRSTANTGVGTPPYVDMGAYERRSVTGCRWHVKVGGTGDGSSWAEAAGDLWLVLQNAGTGDEVWVAEGTYKPVDPSAGDPRATSFVLADGAAVYGGFAGTETARDQRDWRVHETTLSGDLAGDDGADFVGNGENSYHVVIGAANAALDGFTIAGGNANGGAAADQNGGGIYCSGADGVAVSNCILRSCSSQNTGGAMTYTAAAGGVISACRFLGNRSTWGGGLYVGSSPCGLFNCEFRNNAATANGGGVQTGSSIGSPMADLANCTFVGNTAGGSGGGLNIDDTTSATVTSCVFWDNTATAGTEQIGDGSSGQATASHSDIGPGSEHSGTTGNISLDPQFVDADGDDGVPGTLDDDFRLQATSPCIDAGDPASTVTEDILGNQRYDAPSVGTAGTVVEMGAHEWQRAGTIWYVVEGAAGSGASWADASGDLAQVLVGAEPLDEVWVAQGTCTPGTLEADSFVLAPLVAVYGGFAGTETSRDQRDPAAHETVLSGDIDGDGVLDADNSYHVVAGASYALLDGFIVRGGYADGGGDDDSGGGVYASAAIGLTVANCRIEANFATGQGGGMFCAAGSSVELVDCVVDGNQSAVTGGGIRVSSSDFLAESCIVRANNATFGGGFYAAAGNVRVTNCVIADNTYAQNGGGVSISGAGTPCTITNCSIVRNLAVGAIAHRGGGIFTGNATDRIDVTNCILWGNTKDGGAVSSIHVWGSRADILVTSSCIEGWSGAGIGDEPGGSITDGGGVIETDPLLVGAGLGRLQLRAASPCIDTGTPHGAPVTDVEGNARPYGACVDMGAYEWRGQTGNRWYVTEGGTGDGSSWAKAAGDLRLVLQNAGAGDEVWVAEGTYRPTTGADRALSFALAQGAAVYGGFAGTETSRDQRDPAAHETILSGDIGTEGDDFDNSYQVVTGAANASIDGFTVTGGKADGADPYDRGGGIYAEDADGLAVVGCIFAGNSSTNSAGGLQCRGTMDAAVSRVRFLANSSNWGGGISCINSVYLTLENCEFSGNSASADGGGMHLGFGALAAVTNCTFAGNTAAVHGGGLNAHESGTTASVAGSVFWGNVAQAGSEQIGKDGFGVIVVSFSDVGASGQFTDAGGNIAADPQFVDADGADDIVGTTDDDLRLQTGSPCIDAADGDAAPETDIAGLARHDDLTVTDTGTGDPSCADMGAREYQGLLGDAPPGIGGGCGGSPGAVAPWLLILLVLGARRRRHAVAARAGP